MLIKKETQEKKKPNNWKHIIRLKLSVLAKQCFLLGMNIFCLKIFNYSYLWHLLLEAGSLLGPKDRTAGLPRKAGKALSCSGIQVEVPQTHPRDPTAVFQQKLSQTKQLGWIHHHFWIRFYLIRTFPSRSYSRAGSDEQAGVLCGLDQIPNELCKTE